MEKASELLEVRLDDIEKYLMDLAMERKIVMKEVGETPCVYAASYFLKKRSLYFCYLR